MFSKPASLRTFCVTGAWLVGLWTYAAFAMPDDKHISCLGAALGQVFHSTTREGPRIYIKASPNARKLEETEEVVMANYNMRQFRMQKKVHRSRKRRAVIYPVEHMPKAMQEQLEIIARDKPDYDFLQEIVMDVQDFSNLAKIYLKDEYHVVAMPIDKTQGNMVWLVRKDFPLDVEIQSHIHIPHPTLPGKKLLVRDLAMLTTWIPEETKADPVFTAIGVHYKSMGGKPVRGDRGGTLRRTDEIAYTAAVAEELFALYGKDYPIMVLGDFNLDIPNAGELAPLRRIGFKDTFALSREELRKRGEPLPPPPVTSSFFKKKTSKAKFSQLDGQLVSDGFQEHDALIDVKVQPYLDPFGREKGPARTRDELNAQSSDHNAVIGRYSLQKLVKRTLRKLKAHQEDVHPLDGPSKNQP